MSHTLLGMVTSENGLKTSTLHWSETQRHNFEEPFAIEKVSLFEKRELSCVCLK